jgi:hypothetical protein
MFGGVAWVEASENSMCRRASEDAESCAIAWAFGSTCFSLCGFGFRHGKIKPTQAEACATEDRIRIGEADRGNGCILCVAERPNG